MSNSAIELRMKIFGATLRNFRERAALTRGDVAERLSYAESTIQAWEVGKRAPLLRTVKELDELFEAQEALLVAAKGFEEDGKYPEHFEEQAKYEPECLSFMSYDTMAIPGLLQTEAYARAALQASYPRLEDDDVERLVSGRLERQGLLTRRPSANLSFVIDEAACRRPIGGRPAFREQLAKVLACAELRHVTIQVLALDAPEHNGLDGPLVLLTTAEGRELGFIEGPMTNVCVAEPDQLHTLAQRHGMIRTHALNPKESIKLIEQIIGEL